MSNPAQPNEAALPKDSALLRCSGGTITLPSMPLLSREDGGHLWVNPPRRIWERSELNPIELMHWSFLIAATAQAMLDALPQLAGGCINYWEAGNWALNDCAEPVGPKNPKTHRQVHMHLLGRNPKAKHPDWRWGESPRFPDFVHAKTWAASFELLTSTECQAIVKKTRVLLVEKYGLQRSLLMA